MKLTEAQLNLIYEITDIQSSKDIQMRLSELGLSIGRNLKLVRTIPFQGPFLIEIQDTVLALRREEAECIQIKTL